MVKMHLETSILVSLIFACYSWSYPSFDYDGSCKVGQCKRVPECPTALKAVRERHRHGLGRCGFDGITEIVCCPDFRASHSSENPEQVWTDLPPARLGVSPTPAPRPNPLLNSRKSAIACAEYSNEIKPRLNFNILGGEDAQLGEFPHMAALGYRIDGEMQFECGGSLISDRYVLTAAHCILNADRIKPTVVRLGKIDLYNNSDNVEPLDYGVENIIYHPQYQRRTKFNDVALIRLDRKVIYNDRVHPACLYTKPDDPVGLVATGWGYTSVQKAQGSPVLLKVILSPVALTNCNETYTDRVQRSIRSTQLCAGSEDGTKDTCQGDSGGPLQVQDRQTKNVYNIVGVTSYGLGCGSSNPGVYTRVSSYLDWIEGIVWP